MRYIATLLGVLCLIVSGVARADSEEFGDYIVHYSSLPSVMIPAKVARSYGITRSHYRGILNISVLHKQADGLPQPVKANVSGQVENLHDQVKPLELREIREQDAVYYIAEFAISDGETLKFEVSIETADGTKHRLNFDNVFYVD